MKNLFSTFIVLVFLIGCTNDHNHNASASKNMAIDVKEKQELVFTPSELPYPFSGAVQVGDILYLSGEIGLAKDGTGLVPGGIEAETHRMFERIEATLARHNLDLNDVFKCTVMLADMSEWPAFNQIYAGYFKEGQYPTRSALGANGLALSARVEMECWAYNPQ